MTTRKKQTMQTNIHTYWTRDIDLASALGALGFKLRKNDPVVRVIREGGKHTDTFYLSDECEGDFGRLSARKVFKAWAGEDEQAIAKFKGAHPEAYQVIEYMRALTKNRAMLVQCIKTDVRPMVHHKVGTKDCYMPLDASPELRAKMQTMIEEEA